MRLFISAVSSICANQQNHNLTSQGFCGSVGVEKNLSSERLIRNEMNQKTITLNEEKGEIPNQLNICGDKENRSCGIPGQLTTFSICSSCMFRAGVIGKNCIPQGAKIHH